MCVCQGVVTVKGVPKLSVMDYAARALQANTPADLLFSYCSSIFLTLLPHPSSRHSSLLFISLFSPFLSLSLSLFVLLT